ncbi:hypothetical protein OP862_05390 [Yersinia massiliensis]|nr:MULTISPECIES: hypothetical protein [Yersinia]MDA5550145.1 hypothetical protein [Yersinia massiliensis]UZM80107.1 hypothetical protein OP862_05390 [Yersinia massiliensis]
MADIEITKLNNANTANLKVDDCHLTPINLRLWVGVILPNNVISHSLNR